MADQRDDLDDDDFLSSFFDEEPDDSSSLLEDDDPLGAFFAKEDAAEEEDDFLSSFFDEEPDSSTDEEDDDPLGDFFAEEDAQTEEEEDALLASFFEDNTGEEDEEDDEEISGIFGTLIGRSNIKPEPALPYKREKRKARADITKNSKEDHRLIHRYTKSELEDALKRDYRYMLGRPHMVIQPVTIMADYPYKKKKSDSDEIKSYNVEYDYVMVIGKQRKWRNTEEFKGKAYKLGEIMYVRKGTYWVDGKEMSLQPHFAIIINRSYKRIKSKRIRDLLAPLKQRLRTGKPFSIYKEFPIIIERTGAYS